MPAETLHVSICLRHELEGGDSPSAAASTSHAGPWPLCWRQWQSRTVPSPCLQELPGPIRLVPAPPCPALGCRTYSRCPGEREQLKPTHWAQFFNGFKRKKKKKDAAKQSQRPLLQLHRAMGVDGRGPALDCTLSWGWWPGKPGKRHLVPSLPPQSPLHPPRFLTTFEQFL